MYTIYNFFGHSAAPQENIELPIELPIEYESDDESSYCGFEIMVDDPNLPSMEDDQLVARSLFFLATDSVMRLSERIFAPVTPVAPVAPCVCATATPVAPAAPVAPVAPCVCATATPVAPAAPVAPPPPPPILTELGGIPRPARVMFLGKKMKLPAPESLLIDEMKLHAPKTICMIDEMKAKLEQRRCDGSTDNIMEKLEFLSAAKKRGSRADSFGSNIDVTLNKRRQVIQPECESDSDSDWD
jgi:hypothetical protein